MAMPALMKDLKEFLKSLNSNSVEYLLIPAKQAKTVKAAWPAAARGQAVRLRLGFAPGVSNALLAGSGFRLRRLALRRIADYTSR
jgi:hypothetical protein